VIGALVATTAVAQAVVVARAEMVPRHAVLAGLPQLAGLDLSPDRFDHITPLSPAFVASQSTATTARPTVHHRATPEQTTVTLPATTTSSTAPVVTTTTAPQPLLVVTMSADRSTVARGGRIQYTIVVRNTGSVPFASSATVLSHVPFGTTRKCTGPTSCTQVSGSANPAVHQISFPIDGKKNPIGPGGTTTFTFRVTVDPTTRAGTVLRNHAHLDVPDTAEQTTATVEVKVS